MGLNRRFEAMDILRAAAAGSLLAHHIGIGWGHEGPFSRGFLAVDLFFMLSGFVIAAAYEDRLRQSAHPVGLMLKIRLARMYPVIVLGSVIGLVVAALGVGPAAGIDLPRHFVLQIALIPDFEDHGLFIINGVVWSLLLELIINLCHAALVRRLTLRAVVAIQIVALAALAWAIWAFHGLNAGWGPHNWLGGLARIGFAYTAGVLLFRLRALGKAPKVKAPPLLLAVAVPLAILIPAPAFHGWVKDTLFVVGLCPVLVWLASSADVGRRLRPWSRLAGDLAYPIYAFQSPLIWLWSSLVVSRFGGVVAQAACWLAFLPLIAWIAWASLRFYDAPIRRWLGGAMGTSPPTPAATLP